MQGNHSRQFIVDVFQAGAGTSQNMNLNEVIANRAIQILKGRKGDYRIVHPNDHVNMSQSSNDTFPTAMRIAILLTQPFLIEQIDLLVHSLRRKGKTFKKIFKSGRTHLQDAVPVTLGMEFDAYAAALASAEEKIHDASLYLSRLPIGGTAVGTGINTHPKYRQAVVKNLSSIAGLRLSSGKNLMELMQSTSDFSFYSSALKNLALELIRISNDMRLLSSGPRTGLSEIQIPSVQPGSSIMPGKVNPVICEALAMISFQVIANDIAVSIAAQAGQLELNVMTPVIIHNILGSIEILKNGMAMFRKRCIDDIRANEKRCRGYFESSLGNAAVLNPKIGYAQASEIVQESMRTGEGIFKTLCKKKCMTEEEMRTLFSPQRLTGPNLLGRRVTTRRRRKK
jgi:aspartate ammonia-lyase